MQTAMHTLDTRAVRKYNNDIPNEIQKFLDNTSEARFMKHVDVKEVEEEKPVVKDMFDNSTIDTAKDVLDIELEHLRLKVF